MYNYNLSYFSKFNIKTYNIPIEIIELDGHSFHLFVAGSVNGKTCDFILDTGASKSVFAIEHIGKILDQNPVLQPDIQSAGITAEIMESLNGTIRDFTIGDFLINDLNVVLIDLSSINNLYKSISSKSIWGLIGSDLLLKYKARIDYGEKNLTLKVR